MHAVRLQILPTSDSQALCSISRMANPFAVRAEAARADAPPHLSAWQTARAASSNYANRSATALEGIVLLKSGCTAMKYGKSGSPHATKFVLSSDDRMLSWEGSGLIGKLIPKGEKREVELSNVRRLLVGRESSVFKRYAGTLDSSTRAHLSVSLLFGGGSPVSTGSLMGSSGNLGAASTRESLDLSFDNDEIFGLWVAALRELIPPSALLPREPLYGEGRPMGIPPPPPRHPAHC